MKSAVVVDDHPLMRYVLKIALKKLGFLVLGEADNGIDGLRLVRNLQPDLLILDIAMPKLDGAKVLSEIVAALLPTRVLVLTELPVDYFSLHFMQLGASGFVCKSDDVCRLQAAIEAVGAGGKYFYGS